MCKSDKTCKVLLELPQITLKHLDTFAKEQGMSRAECLQSLLDSHQQKTSSQADRTLLDDLKKVYDGIRLLKHSQTLLVPKTI